MAPTITTQTHALVINQEVSFGTIVGGPFDFLDVFVDMSANPNADNTLAEWRIYATNGLVTSLVATAPGGGAEPAVLNWNVGSSNAPGPYQPAKAAGTTYELRAFFTNSTKSFASFASPNPPPQIVKASLIGYNQFDTVPNANSGGAPVILPTNFSEVTIATLNGYAQNADISVVQNFNVPVKFRLYAVAGVGGVQAEVASFVLDQPDGLNVPGGTTRILSPVRLPGATSYILTAAFDFPQIQFPPAVPVAIQASLAIYSSNISAGAVVNLVGNDNGPSNANRFLTLPIPAANADVIIPEVGTVPGDGWWSVRISGLAALHQALLPLNPTDGEVVVLTDEDGSLAGQTFNVNGNGHNVEGVGIFPMNAVYPGAFGSICLEFSAGVGPGPGAWHIFADYDANAGGALNLVGNVNGPSGANRFLALTLTGLDNNVVVPEATGWWSVRMRGLTADRTVTLPAAPTNGMVVVVKDGDGSLQAHNIIVTGLANPIDEVAGPYTMTAVQNGVKGSVTFEFYSAAPAGWYIV